MPACRATRGCGALTDWFAWMTTAMAAPPVSAHYGNRWGKWQDK
jgi:hypothetical protein